MRVISHYVAACLSEMGAVHWLEGGSLLGAVRENGALLDWEDDIDISVLLDTDMTWDRLTAGLAERGARDGYFIDTFEKKGFISVSFDPPKRWPMSWERNRLRGEIRVDIAIYRRAISHGDAVLERCSHKGEMASTEYGGYGVSQEIVLPTSTINFLDGNIACPNKSDAYLRILYGDFEEIEYTYVDEAAAVTRRQADRARKTRMNASGFK
jgi:phosphorylcholine metabolism protein LicD